MFWIDTNLTSIAYKNSSPIQFCPFIIKMVSQIASLYIGFSITVIVFYIFTYFSFKCVENKMSTCELWIRYLLPYIFACVFIFTGDLYFFVWLWVTNQCFLYQPKRFSGISCWASLVITPPLQMLFGSVLISHFFKEQFCHV